MDNGREQYVEPQIIYEIGVEDAKKFTETILNLFKDKESFLYIDSWDFHHKYRNRFKKFEITTKLKKRFLFLPSRIYQINNEMVNNFIDDFLNNVDVEKSIWTFTIYQDNSEILMCYDSFVSVFAKVEIPKDLLDKMLKDGVISYCEAFPKPYLKSKN